MKQGATNLRLHITPELSDQIYDYLMRHNGDQSFNIQKLIQQGLAVENGQYKTQELVIIQEQMKALNRNHKVTNERLTNIENALADIDDDILNQQSDLDPLIDLNKKSDPNQ